MLTSIIYKSPAKLNLFLDILSKRADGYHEILTLMVKVNLYDFLKISKIKKKKISLTVDGDAPEGEENICLRAAKWMQKKFTLHSGIGIELKKNIPPESGLGGASSDAAYVIKGINKIFGLGLSEEELLKIGFEMGSDVPFFIIPSGWAVVSGRGEILRELHPALHFWAVLVLPNFRIRTSDAYAKWRASLTSRNLWNKIKNCNSEELDFDFLKKYSYNVFEKIVNKKEIFSLKRHFKKLGAKITGLTGSGSTIYGLFLKRKEAMRGRKFLSSLGYQVYLVESLSTREGGVCVGDYRN